ncbi:MAG: ComEC/Rec2 family competence protein [Rhizobiaceae bacterium]
MSKLEIQQDVGAVNAEWLPVSGGIKLDEVENTSPIEAPSPYVYQQPTVARGVKFRLGLFATRPLAILQRALIAEREAGAGFLWSPVLFGLGCLIYFNLPREPLTWAFPLLALVSAIIAWRVGRGHWTWGIFVAILLITAGVSAGQLRTRLVDTKMLSKNYVGSVLGQIIEAEYRANGSFRYTLDVSRKDGLKIRGVTRLPERIRLSARKGGKAFQVGQFIKGRARLGPPPGPSFPGAFDFAFLTWFKGIGASGFFLNRPIAVNITELDEGTWALKIARVRSGVARIIRQTLPGQSGGLAAALIVGDRSGISKDTAEVLRRSGLAHILAISGLHMALVSVTLIYFMRGLFACFPSIALHYPVRKWASAVALFAAAAYLLLSGASVSTQRAFIMISIMLLAVLVDRRALTMRNVALAAFVVLLLAPEAVLTPGFQMSFAAVAGLVATYEFISKRRRNNNQVQSNGLLGFVKRFVLRDMGGLALTSLVAGVATGLFAAFHFYRIAPFGLIANLIAMPLVSFAVMPLALVSVLAMPFGLETFSLELMAFAMAKVVDVARWVSTLEPHGNTGFIPVWAFGSGTVSLLLATLMRSWLKVLSIPFVIVFGLIVMGRTTPEILILENGKQIGVVDVADGRLQLLRPNAYKFSTKIWRGAYDPSHLDYVSSVKRGRADEGYACDQWGCAVMVKGYFLVQLSSTAGLVEDCRLADILIIPFFTPNACHFLPENERPMVIDRAKLTRYGAHAIYINTPRTVGKSRRAALAKGEIIVEQAHGENPRPWTAQKFK